MQPLKVVISNSQYKKTTQVNDKNLAFLAVYNYGSAAIQVVWNGITYTVAPIDAKLQPSAPFTIELTGCVFDVDFDLIVPTGGVAIVHKGKYDPCAI